MVPTLIPPPQQNEVSMPLAAPGSFPGEFDHIAPDGFVVFSKKVPHRQLDVDLVHTLEHESVVCCVRFSPDGKYLATGCNRSAQIYDTKTGAKICVLVDAAARREDIYIRSLCFSPNGKLLATGGDDKNVRIWDIATRRIRSIFEGHQQEIFSIYFSHDGRFIVSGSRDKTVRIWDMETEHRNKTLSVTEPAGVDTGVTSVAISPDGWLVAAGCLDSIVRIWDIQTGQLIEQLMGHHDSVYSVAFTPDGKGLVSGSLDQTIKHWDLGPLRMTSQRAGPSSYEWGVNAAVKNNGRASAKGCVCTATFTGHEDYTLSVAVSHDIQWVVSGSKDRRVIFWDFSMAQAQLTLQGHTNSVVSVDLSPKGGMLATGGMDLRARLWNYTTRQ